MERKTKMSIRKYVHELLIENEVKSGWIDLIMDPTLPDERSPKKELYKVMMELEEASYHPPRENILRAFSFFEPMDTKVILIGQDPVLPNPRDGRELATGLSFSMNCKDLELEPEWGCCKKGHSVWVLHKWLKEENILDYKSLSCSHEEWASRGVLLLNSSLTVGEKAGDHGDLWIGFIVKLFREFVLMYQEYFENCWNDLDYWNFSPIYVPLLGRKASNLWKVIEEKCDTDREHLHIHSNTVVRLFEEKDLYHPAHPNLYFDDEIEKKFFRKINEEHPCIFYISPHNSINKHNSAKTCLFF